MLSNLFRGMLLRNNAIANQFHTDVLLDKACHNHHS